MPAAALEASAPGMPRSITVTPIPRWQSRSATAQPMMPPPMMATSVADCGGGLAVIKSRPSGRAVRCSFPSSDFDIQTLFCASTISVAQSGYESTSSSPFLGPRMKTESSSASARKALGAKMVTSREAVAG